MAYSYQDTVADGVTTQVAVSIKFLDRSHLRVYVDGVSTSFTWVSPSVDTIVLPSAPAANKVIRVQRKTPRDTVPHIYARGSQFSTATVDANNLHLLYIEQEIQEGFVDITADQVTTPSIGAFSTVGDFIRSIISSAGSAIVGFVQAGIGSINRTVRDKLRETVSVTDFGADITGVQVCRDAILKAHATGKRVFYPSGIYNLGDLIQIGDVTQYAVDFTGMGTIIMDTDSNVVFRTNMLSGGITYAFKFDGNSHSTIGNCRFEGYGYDATASWKGTSAFLLNGGDWGNIKFGIISCKNMVSPLVAAGGSPTSRIKGIYSDGLYCDDTYYGYNGVNQGDCVRIKSIYHKRGYRALFPYGCTDVVVDSILIENPRSTTGTICIASYPGGTTRGIKAKVQSKDIAVGTTVTHILFENFGPAYATSGIYGCSIDAVIDDPNSGNNLYKVVTYDASGGSETSIATAAGFSGNRINVVPLGAARLGACTARFTTPQRNYTDTPAILDYSSIAALAWTDYTAFTPAWTADSGSPSIGNGTLVGEWYIADGRVYVNIVLVVGSTTTLGSGAWYFWTPYQGVSKSALTQVVGTARMLRAGSSFQLAAVTMGAGAVNVQLTPHSGGTQVGAASPWAWAVNDNILMSYSYPI